MYELNYRKLIEGRERALQRAAWPLVIPLGQDPEGIWHYRVISVRTDGTVSDHAASFGSSVFDFGGCTCQAGQHHNQCIHVAVAYPVHQTFMQVASWLWPQL